jgi:hypothetical protein
MLSRRACALALGQGLLLRRGLAATSKRLAVLLAAPWEGESFLGDDVAIMQEGLRARGVDAGEVISVLAPLDRPRLVRHLEDVRERIAAWQDGELLLYYNGHGMYGSEVNGLREPGLQLGPDRDQPTSALLWRELFATLRAPRKVRVTVLPDCCHTNLLVGRLPANVTALIMKSDPQNSLSCRTGTALFGEPPKRTRHGVISYYAARTLATAGNTGAWLSAFSAATERDVAEGKLQAIRRVRLMIEGDSSVRLPGRPAHPATGDPTTHKNAGER